jgi:hypothetical protein
LSSGAPDSAPNAATEVRPHYFAIGCFTTVAGFAGGGMIGVLVAKIVGAIGRCAAEAETGAPCNWLTFAAYGAIVGAIVLPTIAILLLKRARTRAQNSERG